MCVPTTQEANHAKHRTQNNAHILHLTIVKAHEGTRISAFLIVFSVQSAVNLQVSLSMCPTGELLTWQANPAKDCCRNRVKARCTYHDSWNACSLLSVATRGTI